MKKIAIFIVVMSINLTLFSCASANNDPNRNLLDQFPKLNEYNCHVESFRGSLYWVYKLNYDIGLDDYWKTVEYTLPTEFFSPNSFQFHEHINNKAHVNVPFTIDYFDERAAERLLLSQGRKLIGWEASNGRLVSSSNPIVISFSSCRSEPAVIQARTEEVSFFYTFIKDTNVSDELANLAFEKDYIGVKDYLSNHQYTEIEISSILWTLFLIQTHPKGSSTYRRIELNDLREAISDFQSIYTLFDSSYFSYLNKLVNIDFVGKNLEWNTIGFTQSGVIFEYRYRMSEVQNQDGRIELKLLQHDTGDYSLEITNREGDKCSPSLSNCQFYTPARTTSTKWLSNGMTESEVRLPVRAWSQNIKRESLEDLLNDARKLWIEVNGLE